jgi:predicted helicase
MDGFRKCLVDEFTNIYCFNLRGFIRGKSGNDAKKEGQNVFNIMTGIAITLLVKNPNKKPENKVLYYDIGDYLSRSQKLNIIHYFADISAIKWEEITPNDSYDWINHRNDIFETFTSLSDKKDKASKTIFEVCCNGIVTATYEKQSELGSLFATANTEQYTKKSNIPDSILKEYQQKYQDKTISKEDIFYYIYGVLHSPEYKQRFASDLKKMLPRIPFTADFWTFSQAGRELAYIISTMKP